MPFGSAEVDAEVLYVAGDDEDAFGPAPPAAAAEAKPNTIVLKVVSQYGTEGVLLPPHVPAFVHTNAVAPVCEEKGESFASLLVGVRPSPCRPSAECRR